MTRRSFFSGLLIVAALACSTKRDAPLEPAWGKTTCAHCSMLVGDKRYAAQAEADGERLFFDDLGCMVLWNEDHKASHVWAHRADGEGWVEASTATFAVGARTPMGFGVEARSGAPLSWLQVRERVVNHARTTP